MKRRGYRAPKAPPNAHPMVRWLFTEIARQQLTYDELSRVAGVAENTISNWRRYRNPTLTNFEACANALGFDIVVVPRPTPPAGQG